MKKQECSICEQLEVVPGKLDDYQSLSRWHYRDDKLSPHAAIYAIRAKNKFQRRLSGQAVGVIVYSMPTPCIELRTVATNGLFTGLNRADMLAMVNKNVRSISRVIIEPRFRSLGLAQRLVRETRGKINVPIIESLAVMGKVNPFFIKAGMTAFHGKELCRCAQLREAFDLVDINEDIFIDPETVNRRLQKIPAPRNSFIENQIDLFLASYGKRRNMTPGLERTKFVLSKLSDRPAYFFWRNPDLQIMA